MSIIFYLLILIFTLELRADLTTDTVRGHGLPKPTVVGVWRDKSDRGDG